jgi:hypothetical protein
VALAQNPTELWAKLWKHKYTLNTPQAHLIRLKDQIQGSNIWNAAWKNRPLIQAHAFWEIRNGQNALFWMDSWQQLPPLQSKDNLHPYQDHIQDLKLLKVADLWIGCLSSPSLAQLEKFPHRTSMCQQIVIYNFGETW